jgi:hypothetical protein
MFRCRSFKNTHRFRISISVFHGFIQDYLVSYLVYCAQKSYYEHSVKIGISETKYSRMGLVGEALHAL